ncbi:hypothetical protein Halha_1562 [Halobacteroides halobius DSM 5150]|uniref:PD-(D/E)XK endonuclease-like domain-containing protein n=1 Tax=Halobacteroides halobius (strain ATCC 35273 / DSM 5150 / MD-1) TaxID=748449 RepID=L0K908_HALHC|nr:PD-(D/E)XK nuclease family protein [Halobacteroides halobius]AGB41501.1 hypothetical protein Halha_1562 [Halobacteroides halobius DSM 5150]
MSSQVIDDLYFSASALKTYDTCQLKFKRRYIDGLFWPDDWIKDKEKRKLQEQGNLFHMLAERYYFRGKIVDSKDIISEEMITWLERLTNFRPYNKQDQFLPEHKLQLNNGDLKLMAKYDLLHFSEAGRVVIYDWKTHATNSKVNYLKRSLQTVVYRYLLCKAGGDYAPEGSWQPKDITLVYWNPRFPDDEKVLFYNQERYLRDERKIKRMISDIKQVSFRADDDVLATSEEKNCLYCEYRPICHGEPALEIEPKEEDLDLTEDWDDIEAISF